MEIIFCDFSVIHLFPWSGILDENYELSETFQVPDIKTGKMVRLMSQLTSKEEEMFRNMIRRLNSIVTVRIYKNGTTRKYRV